MIKPFMLCAAAAVAASVSAASADQLEDILASGEIVCGTIGTVPPFNFQDAETRETTGYDIDICKLIATDLGVEASVKLVAGSARIPELNRGGFDIITGSLGWTPERAEQVNYSHIGFISNQMVGVLESSGIASVKELEDKRIAAQASSTSEKAVREAMPDASVVTFQDVPQALLALKQGKVAGLALGEMMLQEFKADDPDIKVLEDSVLMVEKQAVGVRKGEDALLARINEILDAAADDGRFDAIFDKWLGEGSKFKMTRTFEVEPI